MNPNRILRFFFLTLLAFTGGLSAQQPVKIYILAGQSNMLGKGIISGESTPGTVDHTYANDPEGRYQFLKSGGSHVVRNDVFIRDQDSVTGGLTVGYGGEASGLIGPELGFGHIMGDLTENPILIVKCAWGGRSLAHEFCPPSSRVGEPEPVTSSDKGYYYNRVISLVNEAIAGLGTYVPGYAGQGYEIAGFAWHQGWNDRINPTFSAAYEANMVNFINDMRSELGVPNLPFVIATTGMDGWKDYTEVELAQLAMADPAAHPAFAGNVKTIDVRAGYEGLEFWQSQDKSPASDSIHWHRNAKTYLNIGLAMADAMSLMAPARCPYRLKASGDGSGVTLEWQNGTDAITSVQILRGGVEIAAAHPGGTTTFLDSTATPGSHDYQLVFTKSGDPCPPLTLTFDAGVTGLDAYRSQTNVQLNWQNNLGYDAIEVRREGALIATLGGGATSYLDTDAPASGLVTYSVVPTNGSAAPATVQIDLDTASPGNALVYEPFEDLDPDLDGNVTGNGLTGDWSGGSLDVAAGSLTYGALPTSGGRALNDPGNAQSGSAILRPELAASGLLDDGAVLWFSFLTNNPTGTNTVVQFALASNRGGVTGGLSGDGQGIGVRINRGESPLATTWSPDPSSAAFTGTALQNNTTALVVGKVTWGANAAASDTVEIFLPGTDLALPGSAVSTQSAVLDQSAFDVITFSGKNGTAPGIDEIRIGAIYNDIIAADQQGPDEDAPNPDPTSWATPPAAAGDSSITMTATTATDPNGVQYFFEETSGNAGGSDSGWQAGASYTDEGLDPETTYSYRVKARDLSSNANETGWSPVESATTDAVDVTAPATPVFDTPPAAVSPTEITMTAGTVSDPSGVEYFFTSLSVGGHDSGWQDSPTYTDSGLSPETEYSYTVTARDKSANQNTSGASAPQSATTPAIPTGPGGAIIYEPFADSDPTLTGNTPGTGLTGTWQTSGTTWNVSSPGMTFGTLPTSGNRVVNDPRGTHGVAFGTTLSNAGLLDHGTTLWFSFLWKMDDVAVSNGDAAFALGTDILSGGNNNGMPMTNSGSGIGVSMATGNGTITAGNWSGGSRAVGTPSASWPGRSAPVLVVGKITWGANGTATDTVEIYTPSTTLELPAVPVSSRSAVLDQSLFDTITFGTKNEGAPQIDEIRFGATYEDVIGAGGATPDDYDTWSAAYPAADLSAPGDDFDKDGLTNNEERIWGLDPTSGASVNIYTAPFNVSAGTFAYSRRNPSLSGASFTYVYSTTLAEDGWLPLTPALEDASGTSPVESVTVTLPASLMENTRLFVRIIATEN